MNNKNVANDKKGAISILTYCMGVGALILGLTTFILGRIILG